MKKKLVRRVTSGMVRLIKNGDASSLIRDVQDTPTAILVALLYFKEHEAEVAPRVGSILMDEVNWLLEEVPV